ncbi:hypothetical protein FSP39_000405 [Pinctada imbricata]|uniref:ABC-type glutathione-S-conjugate transporter n=1 Tax=Pinctada imbricata TaxID=66713 RepID=A0AA88XYH8_PINIB|nr:hypothetical protein FSP39_000405 [Pinctada imbricata]
MQNDDVLSGDAPAFTPCFQDTVLVYIPFGWLLVSMPFYLRFLLKKPPGPDLPVSALSLSKSILCVVLAILVVVEMWMHDEYMYLCQFDDVPISYHVGAAVRIVSFVFLVFAIQFIRKKHEYNSGVLYMFWSLLLMSSIIPLQWKISFQPSCPSSILYYVYFAAIIVQIVLHSFIDKDREQEYTNVDEKSDCPESKASVMNKLTFWWLNGVVTTAYKRTIGIKDLWKQTPDLQSDTCIPAIEKEWYREVERCKSFIIDYIESKGPNDSTDWRGYTLAVLFFLFGIIMSVFFSQSGFIMMRLGLKVKSALIGLIYRKALTISNASKKNYSVGDIVNLMSVDCQRIQNGFQLQHEIVSFVDVMILGLYLVWMEMGTATLGSVAIIIIFGGLNLMLGRFQQIYQTVILKMKSSRIRLLKEVLNGIKVLKMYTWEPVFTSKLLSIRANEMTYMRKYANASSFAMLLSVHSPFFMTFSILLLYVFMSEDGYLSASKVFTALSTINIVRFELGVMPYVITGVTQLIVSLGRIQDFLCKEDIDEENVSHCQQSDYAVSIENGTFSWDRTDPNITLKDIEVKVPEGKLVAVVGQVGSGKSSLISAILGELEKLSGKVNVKGTVGYVPQEAWIQNLTVKENILFGEKFSRKKYQKVITACALLPDLAILSAGDETEIGEKGINVSGGQKQRISLARAVYHNCDVYLLDDPLSAVDSHVGKDLFKNVIGNNGLLKNKTRILVTHGIHWLPMVDMIIVMDNGRIRETGTYEELLQRKDVFAHFLQSCLLQSNPDDDHEDKDISKMKDKMLVQVESALSDYEGMSTEESLSRKITIRQASKAAMLNDKHQHITTAVFQENTSGRSIQRQVSENLSALTESLPHGNVTALNAALTEGGPLYDDEATDKKAAGSLTTEETTQVGSVKLSVFVSYVKAMGYIGTFVSLTSLMLFHGLTAYGNYVLTFWTEDELLNNQSLSNTSEYMDRNIYYLSVYGILGFFQGCFVLTFALVGMHCLVNASGKFHSRMLHSIMRSPMSFFDTTPLGRMMNRFSSDIDILDDRLPFTYRLFFYYFFSMLAILIVIGITTPIFLVAIIPVGIVYVVVMRFYLPTARQLKRIESVTRSPIYNHFSETISGASVIRTFRARDRFKAVSNSRVDQNSSFFYAAVTGSWWIGLRLEFFGNILCFLAALFAILQTGINGADVGLSLTYSMQIIYTLNFVIQSVSEMEMNVVSAERVEEYSDLPSEAEWIIPSHRPRSTWPETGNIHFKEYTTRYRPELDLVLKGINCSIRNGEKIGIVGRTGAGKSSMTLSLFRLIEAAGGEINIDSLCIADIGLHDLRSKITILPQDPILFSGSLKENLDPLNKYSDPEMWVAIERAHLKPYIMTQPAQLNMECGEGGSNFSVGQRQLVCLARTLLHKTKVLILDEATAAVDIETDELIQETIRTEFSECTVLTIAHRLNTVMDYDRIMVLDKGLIVEFDSPKVLLGKANGVFFKMAKDANLVE